MWYSFVGAVPETCLATIITTDLASRLARGHRITYKQWRGVSRSGAWVPRHRGGQRTPSWASCPSPKQPLLPRARDSCRHLTLFTYLRFSIMYMADCFLNQMKLQRVHNSAPMSFPRNPMYTQCYAFNFQSVPKQRAPLRSKSVLPFV